mmetsp:Transcript_18184/g.39257  ORF Transcript_18184/g.39257 Transcript_18184/m.39257 type:complete len:362 (+) Transcript_18184:99-1184(+)
MDKRSNKASTSKSVDLAGFAPAASMEALLSSAGGTSAQDGIEIDGGDSTMDVKEPASHATFASSATASAKKDQPKKKETKRKAPNKSTLSFADTTNNSFQEDESSPQAIEKAIANIPPLPNVDLSFQPMSLKDIQLRLKQLLLNLPQTLPPIPSEHYTPSSSNTQFPSSHAPIKSFASSLQQTIETYNLLLSLVSSSTYKWGVDRSGASQQNLAVMSSELQQCQEVISSVVSGRLSNVLCPAVDILVGEVEVVREVVDGSGGEMLDEDQQGSKKRKLNDLNDPNNNNNNATTKERRINHHTRPLVDPSYVHLCHVILARNAPLIRHTVATSLHTAQRVIGDYLKAMKKDSGHDMASKGGYY